MSDDYPTQWAYDQACAALEKHRARADETEARIAAYENAITWGVSCTRHAELLDECRRQEERAEQAEAAVARVRRLCDLTIAASCRVQAIEQARDTLAALDGKKGDHDCDPPDDPAHDSPREWTCRICKAAWDRVEHSEDEGEIYETWFERRDTPETDPPQSSLLVPRWAVEALTGPSTLSERGRAEKALKAALDRQEAGC